MYCPSCGNEITVELKYCNRCGANLSQSLTNTPALISVPIRLTAPTVVVGLTIVCGLGIIIGGATGFAQIGIHPAALVWIVLFSLATLFGCTALLIRFWSKRVSLARESAVVESKKPQPAFVPSQLPPRLEPVPSVTEHTTRTFTPAYRDKLER
jgi:hypothetical protein